MVTKFLVISLDVDQSGRRCAGRRGGESGTDILEEARSICMLEVVRRRWHESHEPDPRTREEIPS
uniref:Uncharacterized protein n=1 Tax=Arundo donax TaxID=35708 RepID=A0A0A9CRB8_ARUDO